MCVISACVTDRQTDRKRGRQTFRQIDVIVIQTSREMFKGR